MKKVSGTTKECLQRLGAIIQRDPDYYGKRKIIASFTGVSDSAAYRWIKGTSPPVGEPLIRLRFYLEFLGFDVQEIQLLEPRVRDAARIYAFGVTSIQETAGLLGYKSAKENRGGVDPLLAVFRGASGVSKQRLEAFEAFIELHAEALEEKKRSVVSILPNGSTVNAEVPQSFIAHEVRESKALNAKQHAAERIAIIEALAASVKAIIPLARAASSDDFTANERARVRELAGHNGVMTAANLLFRLCGERTREVHQQSAISKKG